MNSHITKSILTFGIGVFILANVACSAATPTATPLTPGAQPTLGAQALPTASEVQPTMAVLPTVNLTPTGASELVTATKFAVAVTTPTVVAAKPTATQTQVPATPKPAPLSGKIAYSVVTGDAPKFHAIWYANVDGSGARQIITHAQWAILSPEGSRLAYLGSPEGGSKGLYVANADGSSPVLIVNDSGACCANWSHDGAWIVYAVSPRPNFPGGDISKIKIDGAYKTIVPLGVQGNGPSFSPDSKQVVYSGSLPNQGALGLMLVSAEGGAPRQITTDNGGNAQWSPRGDKIVYHASDGAGHRQVFVVNADGSGKKQLTNGKSNDGQPVWSRDGSAIFWRSDQNGTAWAIYVMNADGSNPRKIIDGATPDPTFWGWESLSVSQ